MSSHDRDPSKVLIVGGGVAALEAALALRELAGKLVNITLLAPELEFVYRPMRVLEPFAASGAQRWSLEDIARDLGVELKQDAFAWLDPKRRRVHTSSGEAISYDFLILALGARRVPRFRHALTLDDSILDEQLHGLVQDVEEGYARKVAFLVPPRMPWPLPIYELALMTARRAWDMNENVSVTLATPEDAPLAIFGSAVSQRVEALLEKHGVLTITSAHCEVPEPGLVSVHPGARRLHVDRIIALPELFGPTTPGVPKRPANGFISVDAHCQVPGLEHVYAAGDATDLPVKHGGLAAQQADIAAQAIAALAGAPILPAKFCPEIRGILLGGEHPLYLSARIAGAHGSSSRVEETPSWSPATKIAAKYLGPYLESRDPVATG